MLLFVIAVSVVLVVSFMCSIFESVLLSLTRPQIELMVDSDRRAGRLMARFKQNMDVPIAAILILNTAAHTIGAALAGASYSDVFDASTLWIFSIVFTLAVLLLTEIIPKTLGVSYATTLASPVAHGIRILTVVLRPLVIVSERISRSLRSDTATPVTSAEEIRLLASLGRSEGAVGPGMAGIIVGATHLRDMQAHDVMLPREKIRFLAADMDRDEAVSLVRGSGHSRFPFSRTRDINDIYGIVLAKDLLYWLLQHDDEEIDWDAIVQKPLIVPRSSPVPQLLTTYQRNQRHLAIVVDEYGTVEGIATLEDVLEEIVGEIRDETDLAVKDFHELPGGGLLVRAEVDTRRLAKKLGVIWQPDTGVATVGGLVTETLERIPIVGDSISWQGYKIEVVQASRRRPRVLSISRE